MTTAELIQAVHDDWRRAARCGAGPGPIVRRAAVTAHTAEAPAPELALWYCGRARPHDHGNVFVAPLAASGPCPGCGARPCPPKTSHAATYGACHHGPELWGRLDARGASCIQRGACRLMPESVIPDGYAVSTNLDTRDQTLAPIAAPAPEPEPPGDPCGYCGATAATTDGPDGYRWCDDCAPIAGDELARARARDQAEADAHDRGDDLPLFTVTAEAPPIERPRHQPTPSGGRDFPPDPRLAIANADHAADQARADQRGYVYCPPVYHPDRPDLWAAYEGAYLAEQARSRAWRIPRGATAQVIGWVVAGRVAAYAAEYAEPAHQAAAELYEFGYRQGAAYLAHVARCQAEDRYQAPPVPAAPPWLPEDYAEMPPAPTYARPRLAAVPFPVNADETAPAAITFSAALWREVMEQTDQERGRVGSLPLPSSTRPAPRKARPRDPDQPALIAVPDGERVMFDADGTAYEQAPLFA